MKKILIAYWHGEKYHELYYEHNQEIKYSPENLMDIIQHVTGSNYYVMIRPFDLDGKMIIWIDKHRFGQR